MRLIDEIHLQLPFYGSRRMRDELEERGHTVNRKPGPAPDASDGLEGPVSTASNEPAGKGHKIYPYLLRDLSIERANQAWASDISYIPMAKGVHVPGGDHGLVFSPGAVMAGLEHPGYGLLYRGTGGSSTAL